MPLNKSAMIRYKVIDQCLCNRARKWTWRDILEAVNLELDKQNIGPIGKTTLFEDLKDIEYRVYSSEIIKTYGENKKIVYYQYADQDYSISKQPLTEEEANQIRSAIHIISRFSGLPQFDWVNEMIPILETKLNLKNEPKNIISFETNEYLRGKEYIEILFNAIFYKRVLRVIYQDFKSDFPFEITFHPYHIKQYNSRWFVFGFNPTAPYSIQNLALDRIHEISETSIAYIENDNNWNEYFSDIIGVSMPKNEIVEVKIRIYEKEQALYITTKPIHQSQKPIRKIGDYFETSIQIKPNFEFYRTLLSYGPSISVISPKEVVEKMKSLTKSMSVLY